MPLQHAYATINKAAGLAATAFAWTPATTTNRAFLNDGRMDKQFAVASTAFTVNVVIDFGAAVALSAIALLNNNLGSATAPAVTIEAADDAGMAVNLVTAKASSSIVTTAPRHKDHVLQFASVTRRFWRITFVWADSFALRIGEIFAAATTALTRYTQFGHSEREEFVTTGFRGFSGETRGHFVAGPYRAKTLSFRDLSAAERDQLMAMRRATLGGATPLLWIQQYEAVVTAATSAYQDVIYGRADLPDWGWSEPDYLRFDVDDWSVRSLAREVGS